MDVPCGFDSKSRLSDCLCFRKKSHQYADTSSHKFQSEFRRRRYSPERSQGNVVSSVLDYPRQLPGVSFGVSMVTQSEILFPFNGAARAQIATTAPPTAWIQ